MDSDIFIPEKGQGRKMKAKITGGAAKKGLQGLGTGNEAGLY